MKNANPTPEGFFQDLDQKTAIVTGSTKGIGLEIARIMLSCGANVIVNSRNQKEVDATVERLRSDPNTRGSVIGLHGDVGVYENCEKLAQEAAQHFGKIDVLVNNAGTSMISNSLELQKEDWEKAIRTNLTGPFFMSQVCGKIMAKNHGGSIINISSIFGGGGVPKRLAYCASKFGLNGLTKTLAAEWAHYNIRVNAVSPGFIKTPMDQGDQTSGGYSVEEINRRTPAGRYGTAAEVAQVVLFLASDFSSYITGANILVDGGWLAYVGWDKLLNELE
ncbi:MAG: SDR family oxidoreductase [Thaumarchaeota archaeon]|nr:SDR family oxidoreductase [Nitrososphaerota archaeon]